MSLLSWSIVAIVIVLVGLILYWQLIIAEGAYLGAPLVALLYDWTAERYNQIKEFNAADEDFCLGQPLVVRLHAEPEATVLDVATGTGRIPQVLLRQPHFWGKVVGVDRSSRMLAVARRDAAAYSTRVFFVQADAMALPFAAESVPTVTCLEALEFLPDPCHGLSEMIRVLQPHSAEHPSRGWLLTTNRIGWETWLMPGKTWLQARLEAILNNFSLQHVDIRLWQDIYDLVWAQKIDSLPPKRAAAEQSADSLRL